MIKTKFKRGLSLFLATILSFSALASMVTTTAYAATGERADVYLIDYPRSGDTNNNGAWGHGSLQLMNGSKVMRSQE